MELKQCIHCGSNAYVYDNVTGAPMYCAQCGKNTTWMGADILDNVMANHLESKESGIPECTRCGSQQWKIIEPAKDKRYDDGIDFPVISHCRDCGANYTLPQNKEANTKLVSLIYKRVGKVEPIDVGTIKQSAVAVPNDVNFLPSENIINDATLPELKTAKKGAEKLAKKREAELAKEAEDAAKELERTKAERKKAEAIEQARKAREAREVKRQAKLKEKSENA